MFTPAPDTSAELAAVLLVHYSFDLSGYSASELVNRWQTQYPKDWLHLAVVEALYQGRYKAFSVQQILNFWWRRGQTIFHFNMEFERLICSKFPEILTSLTPPLLPPVKKSNTFTPLSNPVLPKTQKEYEYSKTASVKLLTKEEEKQTRQKEEQQLAISASTHAGVTTSATANSSLSTWSSSIPSPIPNKLAKLLQSKSIEKSITTKPHEDKISAVPNHPPIGQFTPEKSDRSELFTSKLKAISGE
jgi:hypothetical protein